MKKTALAAMLFLPFVASCSPVETKTSLVTPAGSQIRSAGPGDVIMSFQSRKALPNVVGGADIFGRTTNAGGTTVRFIGTRGSRAVFERTDVTVESNATTMSESPMIIPQSTTTTVQGTVAGPTCTEQHAQPHTSTFRRVARRSTRRRSGPSPSHSAAARA